ncbi:MAG: hypothetical protein WBF06_05680 [Candidatus Acidiferrales bacterium]
MKKNRNHRRILWTAAALFLATLALALAPAPAAASPVDNDIISMLPKDAGEVAYANLKAARQYPWFEQLKEQMLPARFKQFEAFLAAAGIDPNTQVEELTWALVPNMPANATATSVPSSEEVVGIAQGQFQPDTAEAYFLSKKVPTVKIRDFTLYSFGSGSGPGDLFLFFLDTNTAVFGQRKQLEELISVRYGEAQGLMANADLSALVNDANGSGLVWAVLDPAYTRLAIQQLAGGAAQFSQASQVIAQLKSMIVSFDADSGIQVHFQAVCTTSDAANTFAALLQAGLLLQKYQAQQTNPDLAALLDETQISPNGDRLDIRLSLTDDQVVALIRRNTFAMGL